MTGIEYGRGWAFALAIALAAAACAQGRMPDAGEKPASLRDTDTDGALRTGARGDLVSGDDTRRLFDYYLTAEGEISREGIRAQVAAEAHRRLPAEAAREAMELYDDYVAYRTEAAAIVREEGTPVGEVIARLRDARERTLGDEPAFADEIVRVERAVAAVRDGASEERFARAAARASEPSAALKDAHAPVEARRAVREARARGADDAEVFAIRRDRLGEAAARRLAELDARRHAWRERVAAYRRERDALPDDLGTAARRDAIRRLRDQHFAGSEKRRVRALDRISGTSSAAP